MQGLERPEAPALGGGIKLCKQDGHGKHLQPLGTESCHYPSIPQL